MTSRRPLVLVVDDSVQDADLVREAFLEAGSAALVERVPGVDAAIDYFRERSSAAGRWPWLVLLDIQMPGKTGFEFLAWLRAQPFDWRRVPVIIMTTSHDLAEVRRAYDAGANSFLVKPTGFAELVDSIRRVSDYWLGVNRLAG